MNRDFFPKIGRLTCLLIFMNISLSAQTVTYEALNSGDWNNPATWVGGNIPPTSNSSNGVRILMQGADKNISLN